MRREQVLFVGDGSRWSRLALDHLRYVFSDVEAILWDFGDATPEIVQTWSGDHIFCFKADLVLPAELLARARKSAINFHPSPPKYRGVGAYYYVVHEGSSDFGVTCHHIIEKIDAGSIIKVQRFPLASAETPEALIERAAAYLLMLLYEVVDLIRTGTALPVSDERWGTRLYTRKMLADFLEREAMPAARTTYRAA